MTVATRLVLICNPNNPTSTALGLDEVERFLEAVPPSVCVILDEAYVEFSLRLGDPHASVELLRRYPNLVLLRTFSKVYGLAGLRTGYALCGSVDLRVAVDQVRQPFYLGIAAHAAAIEALRHQDEVERRVERTIAHRLTLEEAVRGLGLWVAESDANFIWVHLPEDAVEDDVVRGLAERRVLVRAGDVARPRGRLAGDGGHRARERAVRRARWPSSSAELGRPRPRCGPAGTRASPIRSGSASVDTYSHLCSAWLRAERVGVGFRHLFAPDAGWRASGADWVAGIREGRAFRRGRGQNGGEGERIGSG